MEVEEDDPVVVLAGDDAHFGPPLSVLAPPSHRPFSLDEDVALVQRLADCGGLLLAPSLAFLRAICLPRPPPLLLRSLADLLLRWSLLREPLLAAVARAQREGRSELPWEWLQERRPSAEAFGFEQHLALCQLVVARGLVGVALSQRWFHDNVVGRVPLLGRRSAVQLHAEYASRLRKVGEVWWSRRCPAHASL